MRCKPVGSGEIASRSCTETVESSDCAFRPNNVNNKLTRTSLQNVSMS